jgi:hypothetical protein
MKTSATEQVRKHLQRYGRIDQLRCLEKFGTWRLSSIIHELRKSHGMKISTELKEVKTRYGIKTKVAVYRLINSN